MGLSAEVNQSWCPEVSESVKVSTHGDRLELLIGSTIVSLRPGVLFGLELQHLAGSWT